MLPRLVLQLIDSYFNLHFISVRLHIVLTDHGSGARSDFKTFYHSIILFSDIIKIRQYILKDFCHHGRRDGSAIIYTHRFIN